MRGERIAAPMLALLIVFSGAGGAIAPGASPVGTAEAQLGDGSGGACDSADWFLTFVTGTLLTTDCKTAGDVSEAWNETDAKQTRTQIHSQAGQLAAGNEQFLTVQSNLLTDSNTIAFSKGEAAAVEVLANGGTIAEAQAAANESIEDYYTTKQRNLIDRYEVAAETTVTLYQRANQTTGVNSYFVQPSSADSFGGEDNAGHTNSVGNMSGTTSTTNVQLMNGSTAQVTTIGTKIGFFGYDEANYDYSWFNVDQSNHDWEGTSAPQQGVWVAKNPNVDPNNIYNYGDRFRVRPTENLTSKTLLNYGAFAETWNEIETRSQSTKQEVAVYVNQSLGPAVQNGNLNATSYVSPSTLAQEYAQSYNGTESYIQATAIAAYSGMDTPSLEETGSMTISYNGTTYEGLLLSQEAPSGGWQSGETYDPALLSGLQMFAVAGESGEIVTLDQAFTVEKITGTSGEEIQKATTVNVTYETSNASANYTQLQQQIRSLNKQIEERQAQATGGGSDVETNDGLIAKIATALGVGTGVVLLVAAGAVVLIARVYLPDS
jgi:TolA-binding protein